MWALDLPFEESQQSFFQAIQGMSAQAVCSHYESLIGTDEIHESYLNEGKFLPLSVYAAQGYDIDQIKNNARPSDIGENRIRARGQSFYQFVINFKF